MEIKESPINTGRKTLVFYKNNKIQRWLSNKRKTHLLLEDREGLVVEETGGAAPLPPPPPPLPLLPPRCWLKLPDRPVLLYWKASRVSALDWLWDINPDPQKPLYSVFFRFLSTIQQIHQSFQQKNQNLHRNSILKIAIRKLQKHTSIQSQIIELFTQLANQQTLETVIVSYSSITWKDEWRN